MPRVGYWRVAVALCEPFLLDDSERLPTNPQIVARLGSLGLEADDFKVKTVEKRVKHLSDVTGVRAGDRIALRRRLIDGLIVTAEDVRRLLSAP